MDLICTSVQTEILIDEFASQLHNTETRAHSLTAIQRVDLSSQHKVPYSFNNLY